MNRRALLRKGIRWRAQLWMSEARVPVVPPGRFEWRGHPAYGGNYSAYDHDLGTAFIRPDIDRYGFLHELGHCFDYHVLRDEHRALLRQWLGVPPKRFWFWPPGHSPFATGPEAGCEVFADHYAQAAMTRWPRYRRLRRFLKTVAKEAGYAPA